MKKTLEYFIKLGLSEEQAKVAYKDYITDMEMAENTAIDNKNKILEELKQEREINRQMQDRASQDEVMALFASGDTEGAKKLLSDSLLKDHNKSLDEYRAQVTAKNDEYEAMLKDKESRIIDFMFEKEFSNAALNNPLFNKSPGAIKVLKQAALDQFSLKDGEFVYNDGSKLIDGKNVTPENWINGEGFKSEYSFLFQQVEGSGAQPSAGNDNGGKVTGEQYEAMTTAERKEAARNNLL